jgi:hypothetical protein
LSDEVATTEEEVTTATQETTAPEASENQAPANQGNDTPTEENEETTAPSNTAAQEQAATAAQQNQTEQANALFMNFLNEDMMAQGGIMVLFQMLAAFFSGDFSFFQQDGPSSFNRDLFNSRPVTGNDIINNPTFKNSAPGYSVPEGASGIDLDTNLNFETASTLFDKPEHIDAAARTVVNIGIERTVESMEARGVRYGFGDKSGAHAIDCSGLVQRSLENAFALAEDGITVSGDDGAVTISFDRSDANLLATHSDGQIANIGRESGILRGADVSAETLREGMVVGIDTGDRGWDRGRTFGVDHVGIVYRDSETGVMKFAQSSSSGGGVNIQDLDDWLASNTAQRSQLFAVDPVQLGEHSYEAAPTVVAENDATAETDAPQAEAATSDAETGTPETTVAATQEAPTEENTSRTATSAASEIDPDENSNSGVTTVAFNDAAEGVTPEQQPEPQPAPTPVVQPQVYSA